MLFGSPLRAAISRSGSASPDVRNADSTRDEWTTDFTRYGSRGGFGVIELSHPAAEARCGCRSRNALLVCGRAPQTGSLAHFQGLLPAGEQVTGSIGLDGMFRSVK